MIPSTTWRASRKGLPCLPVRTGNKSAINDHCASESNRNLDPHQAAATHPKIFFRHATRPSRYTIHHRRRVGQHVAGRGLVATEPVSVVSIVRQADRRRVSKPSKSTNDPSSRGGPSMNAGSWLALGVVGSRSRRAAPRFGRPYARRRSLPTAVTRTDENLSSHHGSVSGYCRAHFGSGCRSAW